MESDITQSPSAGGGVWEEIKQAGNVKNKGNKSIVKALLSVFLISTPSLSSQLMLNLILYLLIEP